MSGPASMTVRSGASSPLKSGIRTSTPISGLPAAQLADRGRERAGAAVGQVVAGDARDHDVVEAHRRDRLGDPARLVVVEPGGLAGLDRAEAAGPGARVAEDHHRRGALVPALPDVRAAGLLAHGVEVEAAQQALEVVVVVARRHPRLDPVGVTAERAACRRRPGSNAPPPPMRDRDRVGGRRGGRDRGSGRRSGARGPWVGVYGRSAAVRAPSAPPQVSRDPLLERPRARSPARASAFAWLAQ